MCSTTHREAKTVKVTGDASEEAVTAAIKKTGKAILEAPSDAAAAADEPQE